MKKSFLLLVLIFISIQYNASSAINPTWEWLHNTNETINDFTSNDNDIYSVGTTLKKWDTSGNVIWSKPIYGHKIQVDNNHNIIILATMTTPTLAIDTTVLTNNGGSDIIIIKLDSAGNSIWVHNYGNNADDRASEICIDYNGNIYLSGILNNENGVMKFSPSGNHIWTKKINDGILPDVNQANCGRHIDYSAFDSTLVISGRYIDTFCINNLCIHSNFDPLVDPFPTGDIYVAKISLDSNIIFLKNISNHWRNDFDNNSMYVNNSTGYIYVNFSRNTLSGSNTYVNYVSFNGLQTGPFISLNGQNLFGTLIEHFSGDNDSLITFNKYLNFEFTYEIYNTNTGANIKSYSLLQNNKTVFNNNKLYINLYSSLGKLGDPTYVPMSVYNLNDDTVCSNTSFNTTSFVNSGYPPYTVSWSPATGLTSPATLNPGFNLDTTTTYIVTVTDNNNVTIYDTVTFIVLPNAHDSISVLGNSFFCYGTNDSVQLSCNLPGLINKWTDSNLGIVANDTAVIWAYANHTYTLTTTDTATGCYIQSAINLGLHPNYPAIIVDNANGIYADTSIQCNTSDSITLKNYHYSNIASSKVTWYKNGVLIDSNVQFIKTNTSGQYILKIMDSICSHTDTLDVIYSYPSVTAHASNNPVCTGDTIVLYGSGGGTYIWSNNILDSMQFAIIQSNTYHVVVTDTFGCIDSDSISIIVNPAYNISNTAWVCPGATYTFPDGLVMSNIFSQTSHTSFLNTVNSCDSIITTLVKLYQNYYSRHKIDVCSGNSFTFPDGTVQDNITKNIIDTSILQTMSGCDSTIYTEITIIKLDTTISDYRTYLISNANNLSYQWYDCSNDMPIVNETNQKFYPNKDGYYYVRVSYDSCTEKSACYKYLKHEPNDAYFTIYPNPAVDNLIVDYKNEVEGNFRLYNSIGQVIFSTLLPKDKNKLEINVKGLSEGIYNYEVQFKKLKSYTGKITILR